MKTCAGTLLYRTTERGLEVLLVHPSGNYNRRAPWSIPKGVPNAGESLESAARRETAEEAGIMAAELTPLSFIDYRKSAKRVHCFTGPAPADAVPQAASWEVDRAEFVAIERARSLIHQDQAILLDRMESYLRRRQS